MKWNRVLIAGVMLVPMGVASKVSASPAPQPAYLTILLGRSQEYPSYGGECVQLPNTVDLNQAAAKLHSLGMDATGAVITDRTQQSQSTCFGGNLYPSWDQINQLTANDGMSFISAGVDYEDDTLLTPTRAQANICGSLPQFTAHGQNRAWGLFAYPDNHKTTSIQDNITDQCFAFGRKYGQGVNDGVTSPYWAVTDSITGGACNVSGLVCSTLETVSASHTGNNTQAKYWSLPSLESYLHPSPEQWSVVQMYKFVTGSYNVNATSGPRWDCTSPSWQQHYTSIAETYCWGDFLKALSTIPASVRVVDPATVAMAYGRTP